MKKSVSRPSNRAGKPAAARGKHPVRTVDILGRPPRTPAPPPRVPAKWRWHYQTLSTLQSRLSLDRRELRHTAAEPLEPHSLDEADSATDEFDHDLALTQLSVEADSLAEVNEALRRIELGRYGVCEESGRPIPSARLKAVPWTRFTREVEERLEREGAGRRPGLAQPQSVRGPGEVSFVPESEAAEAREQEEEKISGRKPPATSARTNPPRPKTKDQAKAGKR